MTRQPANTCILGCATLKKALTEFGITSQMITVYAEVDHDDGLAPTPVGVPAAPGRGNTGQWTGHLALWLPTLRRFVDPTIYQANRPGRGSTIVMGIVTQLESLQAIENMTILKDGKYVTYRLVSDPDESWREFLTAAEKLVSAAAADLQRDILKWLQTEDGTALQVDLTDTTIIDAIRQLQT